MRSDNSYLKSFGIAHDQAIAFHKAIHGGDVVTILHGKPTYVRMGYATEEIALRYESIVALNPIPCSFTTGDINIRCADRIRLINPVNRPGLGGVEGFLRQL